MLKLPLPYYKEGSKALYTMNIYRNAKFYLQARFKREYSEICEEAIIKEDLPPYNLVSITYTLYLPVTLKKSHKKIDLGNVLSMVDKVFEDSLQHLKVIPDDTLEYVREVIFKYEPLPSKEEGFITVEVEGV